MEMLRSFATSFGAPEIFRDWNSCCPRHPSAGSWPFWCHLSYNGGFFSCQAVVAGEGRSGQCTQPVWAVVSEVFFHLVRQVSCVTDPDVTEMRWELQSYWEVRHISTRAHLQKFLLPKEGQRYIHAFSVLCCLIPETVQWQHRPRPSLSAWCFPDELQAHGVSCRSRELRGSDQT